jgi:hypothetical protein
MEYIPHIIPGIALMISALSYWNSREALRISRDTQHHTQIVSYEQLKQKVRLTIFDTALLLAEISEEQHQAEGFILRSKIDGDMTEEKRAEISQIMRATITTIEIQRHDYQDVLTRLERLPPSHSTEARLILEELDGFATQVKKSIEVVLKKVRHDKATIVEFTSKQIIPSK